MPTGEKNRRNAQQETNVHATTKGESLSQRELNARPSPAAAPPSRATPPFETPEPPDYVGCTNPPTNLPLSHETLTCSLSPRLPFLTFKSDCLDLTYCYLLSEYDCTGPLSALHFVCQPALSFCIERMLRTSRAIAWLSSYFLQPSAFDIVSIAMSLKERSSIHLTPEGPPLLDPA